MTLLKIAINAHSLHRPLTGIGRYTFEICKRLSQDEKIKILLYQLGNVGYENKFKGNTQIRILTTKKPLISNLWMELSIPINSKKDRVDVFWGPANRLPFWLQKNVAQVVTIHDLTWMYFKETMHPRTYFMDKTFMPRALKQADIVVAVSDATARDISKEFPETKGKIRVVKLGVSNLIDTLNNPIKLNCSINRNYFLFVGTIEPRKNLTRLLEAYAALPEDVKNQAVLVIAGSEGWGNVNINDVIQKLSLQNHVKILGYINNEILAHLYANASFLVMPSLYEGFGLPIIEAMSYGTPVLTSNVASMPEVAGEAGLLVDPFDVQSIREGLHTMITNDEVRNNLAGRAKANAANFSWDKAAEQMLEVFKEAIELRQNKQKD